MSLSLTGILIHANQVIILNLIYGIKSGKIFRYRGGMDGTRTRDPLRDRQVF